MAEPRREHETQTFELPADPLDAGLAAGFAPASEPPLPAPSSVLLALGLPALPQVHLREPDNEPLTPVVMPAQR